MSSKGKPKTITIVGDANGPMIQSQGQRGQESLSQHVQAAFLSSKNNTHVDGLVKNWPPEGVFREYVILALSSGEREAG